jgi:4-alpha-glucanotransferase
METIIERAARCGIETEYDDAFGRRRAVSEPVLNRLLEAIRTYAESATRVLPRVIVLRDRDSRRLSLAAEPGSSCRWTIRQSGRIADGEATAPWLTLPSSLRHGLYQLEVVTSRPGQEGSEETVLIVCPDQAYQGGMAPERMWALTVQLYAVRSEHNWGHGDFTDLAALIDLASECGASGIGLNPLHALFDDRAEDASPYSPNTRLFLNPLYIDVEAIRGFSGVDAAGVQTEIARLRKLRLVDYAGVARVKLWALRLAYVAFCNAPSAPPSFTRFREERGAWLTRFACFEVLRRKLGQPWSQWPAEWRRPTASLLESLGQTESSEVGFYEWVQWIAHEQLDGCCKRARDCGLPLGLYIDVAVGVSKDGFDAWSRQDAVLTGVSVGAPPDLLNTGGQNWGLTSFNPVALVDRKFEPYRVTLDASMRYAGAIRLDHVLGLKRLYLIPDQGGANEGAYVRFPFDALLAVTALESSTHECIVIGEDLGTVPAGFRQTLAAWGLWSYQLMLFERLPDGGFVAPKDYRKNALVGFATHDLPTFAAWKASKDLELKEGLGIDPGETRADRREALKALTTALGLRNARDIAFVSVAKYLASSGSRLVVIAMEDVLGEETQTNVPATTDEHPNWRHRLPVTLEQLRGHRALKVVSEIMQSSGRGPASR